MECRDVREMADSFLGEELLTETNHEILRHLDTCPVCRADLAGRRALREGVQRAFHRAPDLGPNPEFIAQLQTKLQDAAHQGSARRGVRLQGWWALAATVLLAVALGVAYRGRDWIAGDGRARACRRRRSSALRAAIPVGGEADLARGSRTTLTAPPIGSSRRLPPDDVMTAVGPAHVLERHACVYRRAAIRAHCVHVSRRARVIARDGGRWRVPLAFPGEALPHLTSASRDRRHVGRVLSTRRVEWSSSPGTSPKTDLLKLAEAVGGPLYRRVARRLRAPALGVNRGRVQSTILFALDRANREQPCQRSGVSRSMVAIHEDSWRRWEPDGVTEAQLGQLRDSLPTLERRCVELDGIGFGTRSNTAICGRATSRGTPGQRVRDPRLGRCGDRASVPRSRAVDGGARQRRARNARECRCPRASVAGPFESFGSAAQLRGALSRAARLCFLDMAVRYRAQRGSMVALHPWMRDLVPYAVRLALERL